MVNIIQRKHIAGLSWGLFKVLKDDVVRQVSNVLHIGRNQPVAPANNDYNVFDNNGNYVPNDDAPLALLNVGVSRITRTEKDFIYRINDFSRTINGQNLSTTLNAQQGVEMGQIIDLAQRIYGFTPVAPTGSVNVRTARGIIAGICQNVRSGQNDRQYDYKNTRIVALNRAIKWLGMPYIAFRLATSALVLVHTVPTLFSIAGAVAVGALLFVETFYFARSLLSTSKEISLMKKTNGGRGINYLPQLRQQSPEPPRSSGRSGQIRPSQ